MVSFVDCLFYPKKPIEKYSYKDIEIYFFNELFNSKNFLSYLKNDNFKIINYTPSVRDKLPYEDLNLYDVKDNAHTILGQEFDNIAVIIDKHFHYKDSTYLSTVGYSVTPFYHPSKMLYQILTRARKKITIIIVNNEEILKRCLEILNAYKTE